MHHFLGLPPPTHDAHLGYPIDQLIYQYCRDVCESYPDCRTCAKTGCVCANYCQRGVFQCTDGKGWCTCQGTCQAPCIAGKCEGLQMISNLLCQFLEDQTGSYDRCRVVRVSAFAQQSTHTAPHCLDIPSMASFVSHCQCDHIGQSCGRSQSVIALFCHIDHAGFPALMVALKVAFATVTSLNSVGYAATSRSLTSLANTTPPYSLTCVRSPDARLYLSAAADPIAFTYAVLALLRSMVCSERPFATS